MPTFAFGSGVNAVPGWGQRTRVRFIGTWAVGDNWTLSFASTEGDFTVGDGNISGSNPTVGLVFGDRGYVGIGSAFAFSQPGDLLKWEEQDPGAGFFPLSSQYGLQDTTKGLEISQGRLAVFGRHTIQIWDTDADPALFARRQVLANTGTVASLSLQSRGDADVFYLDDTGIRSLRTKEITGNAFSDDVGVAIDSIVQAKLASCTAVQKAAACSVIDPESKRYWLFLKDTIYVFSQFPSSKVVAWSTYIPTTGTSEITSFTPEKFLIHGGLVYTLATNKNIYIYGGAAGTAYDDTVVTVELPWLDLGVPSMTKQLLGFDVSMTGNWTFSASCDPTSATLSEIAPRTSSTFDVGHVPYHGHGTHFKLKAVSGNGSTAMTLNMLVVQYNTGSEK